MVVLDWTLDRGTGWLWTCTKRKVNPESWILSLAEPGEVCTSSDVVPGSSLTSWMSRHPPLGAISVGRFTFASEPPLERFRSERRPVFFFSSVLESPQTSECPFSLYRVCWVVFFMTPWLRVGSSEEGFVGFVGSLNQTHIFYLSAFLCLISFKCDLCESHQEMCSFLLFP